MNFRLSVRGCLFTNHQFRLSAPLLVVTYPLIAMISSDFGGAAFNSSRQQQFVSSGFLYL